MSAVTTHVLDTSRGQPAAGIRVTLEAQSDGNWVFRGRSITDTNGRANLLPDGMWLTGSVYRLTFDDLPDGFYPQVTIVFRVTDPSSHYHIPLLLSPYGYTTYRGS